MAPLYMEELKIAQQAVHRASIVTKDVMRGIDAFDKSDASPVTIADFAAQALIICSIHHHFPDHKFIAEESGDMLRADSEALDRVWNLVAGAADLEIKLPLPRDKEDMLKYIDMGCASEDHSPESRLWILDPVDGTATFMQSKQYAVCLCLVVGGKQQVAVLGCPNMDPDTHRVEEDLTDKNGYGTLVFAVLEQGAHKSTMSKDKLGPEQSVHRTAASSDTSSLTAIDSINSGHVNAELRDQVYKSLGTQRSPTDIWSMQMKYVALAFGTADFMIRIPHKPTYRSCVWDHAGGQLIYEEAGGTITDVSGQAFKFEGTRRFKDSCGYVAADKEGHGAILAAVKKIAAEY